MSVISAVVGTYQQCIESSRKVGKVDFGHSAHDVGIVFTQYGASQRIEDGEGGGMEWEGDGKFLGGGIGPEFDGFLPA